MSDVNRILQETAAVNVELESGFGVSQQALEAGVAILRIAREVRTKLTEAQELLRSLGVVATGESAQMNEATVKAAEHYSTAADGLEAMGSGNDWISTALGEARLARSKIWTGSSWHADAGRPVTAPIPDALSTAVAAVQAALSGGEQLERRVDEAMAGLQDASGHALVAKQNVIEYRIDKSGHP